jgi:hypothetical protein
MNGRGIERYAAVQALLANGADPLRKNNTGSTPLHLAVQTSGRGGTGSAPARQLQQEIILLFLRHGAKPTDKDARGKDRRPKRRQRLDTRAPSIEAMNDEEQIMPSALLFIIHHPSFRVRLFRLAFYKRQLD